MAAADGTLPPLGLAARVERELADTSHRVAQLPGPALRALAPVLAQAQRETAQALRDWLSRTKGEERYTPVMHRAVLAHLEQALHTVATLDPTLREALTKAGVDAGRLAAGDAAREFDRFSQLFDREPTRLPVNVIRIVATGQRELIPRFRTSAARYAGDVGVDIRRELAVGLARRESVSAMIDRLVRVGGPKGLVALRGIVGEPGAVTEHIAEGLFARYRYWGERVARTETQRAYNVQIDETLREAREHIPDLMRRWDASADLRICEVCAALHGAVTTIDGAFPGGYTEAPAHPNCRCRVGAWRRSWDRFLAGRVHVPAPVPRPGTLPPPPPPKPRAGTLPPPPPPRPPPAPATLPPGAVPATPTFKTTAAAQKWASARWPSITWDLSGIHADIARELLEEFDRLAREWPAVAARLNYFGTYKTIKRRGSSFRWPSRTYAHATTDGSCIGFNPNYFGKPDKIRAAVASDAASGWHPSGTGTPASILTHEWGHQVDNLLRTLRDRSLVAAEGAPNASIPLLLGDLRVRYKATAGLSRYALKNTEEAFAEAFASLRYTAPALQTEWTQRLGRFLEKVRGSRDVATLPDFRSLSQVERATIVAQVSALRAELGIP